MCLPEYYDMVSGFPLSVKESMPKGSYLFNDVASDGTSAILHLLGGCHQVWTTFKKKGNLIYLLKE